MLNLVTGVPGAKKTAFVVTTLDKIESENKVNLVKNKAVYAHNLTVIDKHKLQADFTYYEYEVGSGYDLKREMEILPDDYFTFLSQDFDDIRPDDYFLKTVRFNEIIERITDRDGDKGFKYFSPVRTIYTNIKALKIDHTRGLLYDWRDCPDGAIIVIDEIQKVEPFKDTKDKANDIVLDLTVHRHRGFDFYLITQSANLLHPQIKDLVSPHYHLTVPFGLRTRVYQYSDYRPYPNTFSNKLSAEAKFGFKPPARIFKLYKSTSINTAKSRVPKKPLIIAGIIAVVVITLFIYGLGGMKKSTVVSNGVPQSATAKTTVSNVSAMPLGGASVVSATALTQVQQVQQIERERLKIEQKYLTNYDIEVANNDNIRPSAIFMKNGHCRAINRFGDNLDVSQALCKLMLKDPTLIPHARQVQQGSTTAPMQEKPMQEAKPVQTTAPISSPAPTSAPAPTVQHSIIKM